MSPQHATRATKQRWRCTGSSGFAAAPAASRPRHINLRCCIPTRPVPQQSRERRCRGDGAGFEDKNETRARAKGWVTAIIPTVGYWCGTHSREKRFLSAYLVCGNLRMTGIEPGKSEITLLRNRFARANKVFPQKPSVLIRERPMLGTILLIVLILILVGALPTWPHSAGWGYYPSGGIGLVVVILLILVLMGRV